MLLELAAVNSRCVNSSNPSGKSTQTIHLFNSRSKACRSTLVLNTPWKAFFLWLSCPMTQMKGISPCWRYEALKQMILFARLRNWKAGVQFLSRLTHSAFHRGHSINKNLYRFWNIMDNMKHRRIVPHYFSKLRLLLSPWSSTDLCHQVYDKLGVQAD